MGYYKIVIKESVKKDVRNIPKKEIIRIIKKIKRFSKNPYPPDSIKLAPNKFRVRQGDYRALYSVDEQERKVIVFKIGHRKDIYRK